MSDVRFAKSYIEQLYIQKDMLGLYHLITTTEQSRILPEQLWLFCRLLEWAGSVRSGVWQYYDGLPAEKFDRISIGLDNNDLAWIALFYRSGKTNPGEADQHDALDYWLDSNRRDIDEAALQLATSRKGWLMGSE
jgi:hypothetical protein